MKKIKKKIRVMAGVSLLLIFFLPAIHNHKEFSKRKNTMQGSSRSVATHLIEEITKGTKWPNIFYDSIYLKSNIQFQILANATSSMRWPFLEIIEITKGTKGHVAHTIEL
jgi:hypothetical protein